MAPAVTACQQHLPNLRVPRSIGYRGHGVYGVGVRVRQREKEGESERGKGSTRPSTCTTPDTGLCWGCVIKKRGEAPVVAPAVSTQGVLVPEVLSSQYAHTVGQRWDPRNQGGSNMTPRLLNGYMYRGTSAPAVLARQPNTTSCAFAFAFGGLVAGFRGVRVQGVGLWSSRGVRVQGVGLGLSSA